MRRLKNLAIKPVIMTCLIVGLVKSIFPLKKQTPLEVEHQETLTLSSKDASLLTESGEDTWQNNQERKESDTHGSRPLRLVSGFGTELVLYSAIASNTSNSSLWDKVTITAWEARHLRNQSYTCCVSYSSGRIISVNATKLMADFGRYSLMQARQFVCLLGDASFNKDDTPVAATLADSSENGCGMPSVHFVDMEYAFKHPGEIAVLGKVLYGNLSAHDLVAWFEVHILQGASKFVIYAYNLNNEDLKVLRYYQDLGKLELIPMSRPSTGAFMKKGQADQYLNDQQVALNDALQRLRGYKYLVSCDVDEYAISRKNESWMTLFDRLFTEHPGIGFRRFRTYFFNKEWGPIDDASKFSISRYVLRTEAIRDTPKFVVIPSEVDDAGLNHHHALYSGEIMKIAIDPEEAAIHHFRRCRGQWRKRSPTGIHCLNFSQYYDETVLNMFRLVVRKVVTIVNELDISSAT